MIAADVTSDSPHFGHLGPMVAATERELVEAGVSKTPEVVVADAGYWHHAQMEDIVTRESRCSCPRTPTSAWATTRMGRRPLRVMRRVLAIDLGADLYGKRRVMIEPVFGDVKFNRRIDRF